MAPYIDPEHPVALDGILLGDAKPFRVRGYFGKPDYNGWRSQWGTFPRTVCPGAAMLETDGRRILGDMWTGEVCIEAVPRWILGLTWEQASRYGPNRYFYHVPSESWGAKDHSNDPLEDQCPTS